MEWNKVSEKEIPFGEEVIAFNEKWIDEDFNPNGTRVGFMQDDGFISATWNNDDDCYDTCYEEGDDFIRAFQVFKEQMNIISSLQSQICQRIG